MPSFYIKTYGCQMNERDSEIMAQTLAEAGYIETSEMTGSDVIIINTCSIREKAAQKIFSLLGLLKFEKRRNPDVKLCVTGCVAQLQAPRIRERMPHVDLVIGTQNIYNIPELLDNIAPKKRVHTKLVDDYKIPAFIPNLKPASSLENSSAASPAQFKRFVNIMQGCNNFCAYCVVPYTRGREVSRLEKDILEEVQVLIDGGVKEITLLGQNVNSYGQTNRVTKDGSPLSFPQLLRKVSDLDGLERIRFTSSNPKDLSDELMDCFDDIDILCSHFHLPVQSGSNNILKRMNRKYTRESYLEKVAGLKSHRPDITISTDMIIGFPGETEDDFAQTMSILEEVRYTGSYSFMYSDRPGTLSEGFKDKIPDEVKSERLQIFQNRQDEITKECNEDCVGKTMNVLVEQTGKTITGRSDTNYIVHIEDKTKEVKPGDIIKAKIIHASNHSLKATLGSGLIS